jgi:hypothetical protein
VGPKAGLDDVEKRKFLTLPGLELQLLGPPARSQSLYRLPPSAITHKILISLNAERAEVTSETSEGLMRSAQLGDGSYPRTSNTQNPKFPPARIDTCHHVSHWEV